MSHVLGGVWCEADVGFVWDDDLDIHTPLDGTFESLLDLRGRDEIWIDDLDSLLRCVDGCGISVSDRSRGLALGSVHDAHLHVKARIAFIPGEVRIVASAADTVLVLLVPGP